jgi:large subunit ribosomal protein L16
MFNFAGLLNRKYKKISGKVRFVGLRSLPKNLPHKNFCALISTGYGLISSEEINASKKIIRKVLGKNKRIKILTRVFPFIPLTGKPLEVRMGRGKGSRIRKWVYNVKPGKILYEIRNVSLKAGRVALLQASNKLSISTKIIGFLKLKSLGSDSF